MTTLSDPPRRRTSMSYIALGQAVGIGSAVSAGAAIALNTIPEAIANGGLNVAVPVILAGVVPFGLSAGWHKLYGYGAHAREKYERAIAAGWGLSLTLVGAGVSGWFLATILGGNAALQDYQLGYVERVRAASDIVSGNFAVEANIVTALKTASDNLAATAKAECSSGLVSGRIGKGVICLSLANSAAGMTSLNARLSKQQQEGDDALARSADDLAEAVRVSAARDATAFQESVAKAVAEIRAAAKVRLGVSSLNIGIVAPVEARRAIDEATNDLGAVMTNINSRLRVVNVPDYQPIDTKKAMLTNPQPLAWLAALVVELLPLICLGLILTIWRDEESPPDESDELPHSLERPRPRIVSSVPAE
jgi:hypothetical protein